MSKLINFKQILDGNKMVTDIGFHKEQISAIKNIIKPVIDEITLTASITNTLTLSKEPNDIPIELYINGILYEEGKEFTVNRSTKTITWTSTALNNGFDINNTIAPYLIVKYFTGKIPVQGFVLTNDFYKASDLFEESYGRTTGITFPCEIRKAKNSEELITVDGFDTSELTTMNEMFNSLGLFADETENDVSIDVFDFDTENVTDMSYMFNNCEKLTKINGISNFNTSRVTNMENMFSCCEKLTSLDLSNFNTSSVANMDNMFNHCEKLTSLDLSNFNTSNVTTMIWMFNYCTSLTNLTLSFDLSSITSTGTVQDMFEHCSPQTGSITFNNVKRSVFTDRATFITAISGSGINDSILTVNFVD